MSDAAALADTPIAAAQRAAAPVTRIEALTRAVLARLAEHMPPRVHVARFPDRPAAFDFQGYEAAVLVICTGGSFGASPTPSRAALRETINVRAPILVRSLDGALGAPALIEDVRIALQGMSLAGGTAMQPLRWALDEQSDGEVWRFDFEFSTTLPAVAGGHHPLMRGP